MSDTTQPIHVEIQTGTVPGLILKCRQCKDKPSSANVQTTSLKKFVRNYENQWRWKCNQCENLRRFEPTDETIEDLVELTFYKNYRDSQRLYVTEILENVFVPRKHARKLCKLSKKMEEDKNNRLDVSVNGTQFEDVKIRGVVC